MKPTDQLVTCPDCGYRLHRPSQDRCNECGLLWADWMDSGRRRIRMGSRDWLLLLLVFPVLASIPPLLTARGAVTGAMTFESSYLLTIPGFAGIIFLSWWYAAPVLWRVTRSKRSAAVEVPEPPARVGGVLVFLLLCLVQAFLFLAVIRVGFVLFVQPMRPPPPVNIPLSTVDLVKPVPEHRVSRAS